MLIFWDGRLVVCQAYNLAELTTKTVSGLLLINTFYRQTAPKSGIIVVAVQSNSWHEMSGIFLCSNDGSRGGAPGERTSSFLVKKINDSPC